MTRLRRLRALLSGSVVRDIAELVGVGVLVLAGFDVSRTFGLVLLGAALIAASSFAARR